MSLDARTCCRVVKELLGATHVTVGYDVSFGDNNPGSHSYSVTAKFSDGKILSGVGESESEAFADCIESPFDDVANLSLLTIERSGDGFLAIAKTPLGTIYSDVSTDADTAILSCAESAFHALYNARFFS